VVGVPPQVKLLNFSSSSSLLLLLRRGASFQFSPSFWFFFFFFGQSFVFPLFLSFFLLAHRLQKEDDEDYNHNWSIITLTFQVGDQIAAVCGGHWF
jgi:hypothetical protein